MAMAMLATIPILAGPASAQQVTLSPSSAPRGGTINLSGDGCFTNSTPPLQFIVQGPSAFPNAGITGFNWSGVTGRWTATLVIPTNATPGTYSLTVRCLRQFAYPVQTFTVTGSSPTTVTTVPPTTVTTVPPTTVTTAPPGTVAPPSRLCATLLSVRSSLAALESTWAEDLIDRLDSLIRSYDCV